MIVSEEITLFGREPREAKHSDLFVNVTPVLGRASYYEGVGERLTHSYDAVSHCLYIHVPLLEEIRIVEDDVDEIGTLNGRVGVHWAS